MKIHIIRHGLTEGNLNHEYSGWDDTPLAAEGIEELHQLKKELSYPKVDVHFSSDLSRARDTHAIIYGEENEPILLKEMREIYFGDFEGKTVKETKNVPFFDGFFKGQRIANGETYDEFSARVNRGLSDIINYLKKNNYEEASLVCHSGVVKAIILILEELEPHNFYQFNILNGRGIVITFDDAGNYLSYSEL